MREDRIEVVFIKTGLKYDTQTVLKNHSKINTVFVFILLCIFSMVDSIQFIFNIRLIVSNEYVKV